jgi:DNA-directed RNA polymerase specialized sigma24 family protein
VTDRWLAATRGKPSLGELYTAERLHLVRLALLLVDDLPTAEDIVQDAFSAMVRVWDEFADGGAARAYLRTCVMNATRSVLRRRRTARAYVPPLEPQHPGADDVAGTACLDRPPTPPSVATPSGPVDSRPPPRGGPPNRRGRSHRHPSCTSSGSP